MAQILILGSPSVSMLLADALVREMHARWAQEGDLDDVSVVQAYEDNPDEAPFVKELGAR